MAVLVDVVPDSEFNCVPGVLRQDLLSSERSAPDVERGQFTTWFFFISVTAAEIICRPWATTFLTA